MTHNHEVSGTRRQAVDVSYTPACRGLHHRDGAVSLIPPAILQAYNNTTTGDWIGGIALMLPVFVGIWL